MTSRKHLMASRSFDSADSRNPIVNRMYQLRVPAKPDSKAQDEYLRGPGIVRSAYGMPFGPWSEQSKANHAGIIALVLVAHGSLLWALLDARLAGTSSQSSAPFTLMPAYGHNGTQQVVISIA